MPKWHVSHYHAIYALVRCRVRLDANPLVVWRRMTFEDSLERSDHNSFILKRNVEEIWEYLEEIWIFVGYLHVFCWKLQFSQRSKTLKRWKPNAIAIGLRFFRVMWKKLIIVYNYWCVLLIFVAVKMFPAPHESPCVTSMWLNIHCIFIISVFSLKRSKDVRTTARIHYKGRATHQYQSPALSQTTSKRNFIESED